MLKFIGHSHPVIWNAPLYYMQNSSIKWILFLGCLFRVTDMEVNIYKSITVLISAALFTNLQFFFRSSNLCEPLFTENLFSDMKLVTIQYYRHFEYLNIIFPNLVKNILSILCHYYSKLQIKKHYETSDFPENK